MYPQPGDVQRPFLPSMILKNQPTQNTKRTGYLTTNAPAMFARAEAEPASDGAARPCDPGSSARYVNSLATLTCLQNVVISRYPDS